MVSALRFLKKYRHALLHISRKCRNHRHIKHENDEEVRVIRDFRFHFEATLFVSDKLTTISTRHC